MLLYVDKKKQKRRRIKNACLIFAVLFIITANTLHFKSTLHRSTQSLTGYIPLKTNQTWYNNADIVNIYTDKKSKTPQIIIIPPRLNRENALTIAYAFSKLPPSTASITVTPEITEQNFLLHLAQIFAPSITISSTKDNILLTSDIKKAEEKITKSRLYPQALNYSHALNSDLPQKLSLILDAKFPQPPLPQNKLEREHAAIKNFVKDYKEELKKIITTKNSPQIPFSFQNNLLKNIALCLEGNEKISCSINKNNSLKKNIALALNGFANKTQPTKLIFLTTEEEVAVNSRLLPNEGLRFSFNNREAFLLPQKRLLLPASINPYAALKQQAGLNPNYQNEDMKFYKFKTTEVILNDKL